MIIPHRTRSSAPRNKSFNLKGGLNTEVANMERAPGELLTCVNYNVVAGAYSGYQSMNGYERYDGQALASTIALETVSAHSTTGGDYDLNDRVSHGGYVFVCIQASGSAVGEPDSTTPGDNTWWELELVDGSPATTATADTYKDVNREAQRTLITALPAYGQVRGLHIFKDMVCGFQNDVEVATETFMYKSSGSGWVQVEHDGSTGNPMDASGNIRAITARFAEYPVANPLGETMYWVDGVTDGFFVWTGTGDYINVNNAISSYIPSGIAPTHIGAWENRLFLVYDNGHILFSTVGDPTDFNSATGTAGEIFIGEPVTGVIATAGVLLIFTQRSTKILHYGSTTNQFIFKLDEFSANTGALQDTVESHFETVFFASDRSASRMLPGQGTGGFVSEQLSDKIVEDYLDIKDDITCTLVDNQHGRYYIFHDNWNDSASYGYTFTLYKGRLKGVGRFELGHRILKATQGILSDGTDMLVIGDDEGMVFKMESGTSFDGTAIACRLTTSYYHYGSPRNWKHFQRLVFEVDCNLETTFNVAPIFDYGDTALQRHAAEDKSVSAGSAIWGSGIQWGSFIWGAGALGKPILYITGHGQNMAVTVRTTNEFATPHTIHNLTVDYTAEAVRQ
jgi:hypothetical protein